ncbi:hypothetical protein AYO47_01040 [Planctomyces sp. SCGC AG-212-M04]|nr:hypothetical protein AYO47_01040 [Planctomyces sp. SCGC AG-212-M04]
MIAGNEAHWRSQCHASHPVRIDPLERGDPPATAEMTLLKHRPERAVISMDAVRRTRLSGSFASLHRNPASHRSVNSSAVSLDCQSNPATLMDHSRMSGAPGGILQKTD